MRRVGRALRPFGARNGSGGGTRDSEACRAADSWPRAQSTGRPPDGAACRDPAGRKQGRHRADRRRPGCRSRVAGSGTRARSAARAGCHGRRPASRTPGSRRVPTPSTQARARTRAPPPRSARPAPRVTRPGGRAPRRGSPRRHPLGLWHHVAPLTSVLPMCHCAFLSPCESRDRPVSGEELPSADSVTMLDDHGTTLTTFSQTYVVLLLSLLIIE